MGKEKFSGKIHDGEQCTAQDRGVQSGQSVEQKSRSEEQKNRNEENAEIKEMGTLDLENDRSGSGIQLLTIIGEIEGHEAVSGNTKATTYEHLLPRLAQIEEDSRTKGVLILLNTLGGDVEAGLAIAEMIASLSKPTVSLVLGGSHSIGGPLAVSADYSFIVPTATMMIHPVRMSGMLIGTQQTYEYFEMIQDRILNFVSSHARIPYDRLKSLMHNTEMLAKDLGTVLVGEEAVKEGLIDLSTIIIDAKSGTSGAGRGAKVDNLFCEVNENMKAYGVASHRHTPEIEEQLSYAAGSPVTISFTPHLVPMNRGILVTAYASLTENVSDDEVRAVYEKYYRDEYFVRVLNENIVPQTRFVEGSNFVDVNVKVDPRTRRVIMMGAMDNLVKGAAGQAVQNMNLMFGLPENTGLKQIPMFP